MGRKQGKIRERFLIVAVSILILSFTVSGCQGSAKKSEPVVLTLWHVYGGQVDSPLNKIIDRFNDTYGKEEGIYVQVTSVSNTNTIHEAVLAAGKNGAGSGRTSGYFRFIP